MLSKNMSCFAENEKPHVLIPYSVQGHIYQSIIQTSIVSSS